MKCRSTKAITFTRNNIFCFGTNYKKVPVLFSHEISIIFPYHLLPSAVHPTGFCFYFFPGFLAISILLSSNNIFFLIRLLKNRCRVSQWLWSTSTREKVFNFHLQEKMLSDFHLQEKMLFYFQSTWSLLLQQY